MSNYVLKDANDARTRYTHQAYDTTTAGKSPETSSLGYQARMSATYTANFQATISADETVVLNLPPYVMVTGYSIPIPSTGGTAPTVAITVAEMDGSNAAIVVAAADPSAAAGPTAATALSPAENLEKKVTFVLDKDGGSGSVTILLQAQIVETAWK